MVNYFCNRLEILIKENKTKKKDLAKEVGVTPAAITNLVKGYSNPSLQTIKSIANYYHVSEEWLAYGAGDKIMADAPQFKPEVFYEKMSPDEIELLKYFRQLCPEQKLMLIPMIKGLLNSPTKSEENDSRERILKAAS